MKTHFRNMKRCDIRSHMQNCRCFCLGLRKTSDSGTRCLFTHSVLPASNSPWQIKTCENISFSFICRIEAMNAPAKKVETERILLKEPVEDSPDKESAHTRWKKKKEVNAEYFRNIVTIAGRPVHLFFILLQVIADHNYRGCWFWGWLSVWSQKIK